MGWRFRRTFGLGGLRWTLSKRGIGESFGFLRDSSLRNITRGRRYMSIRIPGSGLSWVKYYGRGGPSFGPDRAGNPACTGVANPATLRSANNASDRTKESAMVEAKGPRRLVILVSWRGAGSPELVVGRAESVQILECDKLFATAKTVDISATAERLTPGGSVGYWRGLGDGACGTLLRDALFGGDF